MKSLTGCAFHIFISLILTLQQDFVETKAGIHYGRCKNSRISDGFCRSISDCSTLSESAAKLIQNEIGCGSNTKDLICCPLTAASVQSKPTVSLRSESLPKPPICGKVSIANKIFGGQETAIDEFPWMAILLYTERFSGSVCGGTLITEQLVITAAHCVYKKNLNGVRLGEWDTETNNDCQEGRFGLRYCNEPHLDVPVQYIIIHPEYQTSGSYAHDIALLQLDKPIKFTDWIMPICLPAPVSTGSNVNTLAGESMQIAGWGRNEYSISHSNRLLKAELSVWTQELCQNAFDRQQLYEGQICAASKKSGSCLGDSGGPMMYTKRHSMYQIGIISLGGNCKAENLPVIFTNVNFYVNWILEVMENAASGRLDKFILNMF